MQNTVHLLWLLCMSALDFVQRLIIHSKPSHPETDALTQCMLSNGNPSCAHTVQIAHCLHCTRDVHGMFAVLQLELSRNKCRDKRIDVWPRAVDTAVFSPAFRSQAMRERMTDGHPDATILVYVGRLGAGVL